MFFKVICCYVVFVVDWVEKFGVEFVEEGLELYGGLLLCMFKEVFVCCI